MVMHNTHQVTDKIRQRVCDLVMVGTPKYLICEVLDIDDSTLDKYYRKELTTAKTIAIERIGKTVYHQALDGSEKSQALYLKTQGAGHGWVEKQVVENIGNNDTQELRDKIAALEDKYSKDY